MALGTSVMTGLDRVRIVCEVIRTIMPIVAVALQLVILNNLLG
jgi:hypothetical protein